MWIGGFCVVGGAALLFFMVRDYTPLTITIILDRVYDTVIQLCAFKLGMYILRYAFIWILRS
jgi:hypothetical protein